MKESGKLTEENFLEKLTEAENSLLRAMSRDFSMWKGLKHDKKSLENFLNYNIAEIHFKAVTGELKTRIACSNTTLVRLFSLKRGDNYEKRVRQILKQNSKGMPSLSQKSVRSWSFVKNSYMTIPLKDWKIGRFITIKEDNIEIINEVLRQLLKKPNERTQEDETQ